MYGISISAFESDSVSLAMIQRWEKVRKDLLLNLIAFNRFLSAPSKQFNNELPRLLVVIYVVVDPIFLNVRPNL